MHDHGERAIDLMRSGYHCSEAVIRATAERYGFDPGYSRVATALGGGISNCGDLCGILTGGLICVGIMFGRVSEEDGASDARCKALGGEYYQWFMENHGRCCDIVQNRFTGPYDECYRVLRSAAKKLHGMLDQEKSSLLDSHYAKR